MGELRTRKRGKTWEYSFEGAKIGGKRKPVSKGGFRTKAEALAAGTQAKAEYDSAGRVFTPSNMSLSDYLDYWYKRYVTKLAANTQAGYERHIRLHIKPYLGHYRLSALEPHIIQNWIDDILFTQKEMSHQSMACIAGVLSGSLNYAVQPCRYLRNNPCDYVKIPDVAIDLETKKHTEYVCSKDDWEAIMAYFTSTPKHNHHYLTLLTGYHTGERIGEIYGTDLLQDYDPKKHTLSVNHQLQYEKKKLRYVNPKYDSFRTIRIDSILERAIKKELIERKRNMMRYGEYYLKTYMLPDKTIIQLSASNSVPDDWKEIYPLGVRENGKILTSVNAKHFSDIIKDKVGLPYFHPHCLRHTHGTILAENGASPKTIMERLGHKNIAVTLQRYVFNTDKMQQEAADLFERAIQ